MGFIMGIEYDCFLKWAEEKFGKENIKIKGSEILTHSPFTEDYKYHLWMNPYGGKKGRESGAYRCWKTDRAGSLVALVAELDGITFEEAEELIGAITTLNALEEKFHNLFGFQQEESIKSEPVIKIPENTLQLPPCTVEIDVLPNGNFWKKRAFEYLEGRKIPTSDLYVCSDGDYRNRIIIPYYDAHGTLVWYNARTMSPKKNVMRYMKPAEKFVSQDTAIFFKSWPRPGSKIYLTEGEFDAIALYLCGLNGAACGGKSLTAGQIEILRCYTIVLAFDNDKGEGKKDSGGEATLNIGLQLMDAGLRDLYYVRPPIGYKDWNALLQTKDKTVISKYINEYEEIFDTNTVRLLRSKKV